MRTGDSDPAGGAPCGVLLDLGGVLYVGNEPLPGAVEALGRLRRLGIPLRFVTNTSRRPRRQLVADLRAMGFDIEAEELFTAPLAARGWLEREGLRAWPLVEPALLEDLEGVTAGESPGAVLVGDAPSQFDYAHLNRAFRFLMAGARLVAAGRNRYFREAGGLSLDAGPFVAALEYAAGVEAVITGKPAPAFFHEGVAALGCAPGTVWMVGDDVEADVLGATAAGLQGVLVRTGKYRPGDERRLADTAGTVVEDFPAAVDALGRALA